ncbi:MAG: lysine--tRNA ligase [Gemmatimonadota bacterium]
MDDLSQVLLHRRQKLDALASTGTLPYAYSFERSHTTKQAVTAFEAAERDGAVADDIGPEARVGGRVVAWRGHGKTAFAHLEDGHGRLQLYFRKDVLGEERFGILDQVDVGDWIGVEGPTFRTRTGEVTLRVTAFEMLTKSMRPLPFGKTQVDPETGETVTYSGFANQEARYRQRYADLAVHPDVRDVFRARTRIVAELRRFLDARDFLEVETPVLQPLYGGASARPFLTHHNALDATLYLRIADELYLKRLLVGGFERVYEISKDFRNEGIDRFHNPEFTMLEFYQAFADYHDMMRLVEDLFIHVAESVHGEARCTWQEHDIGFTRPFARLRLTDALSEALGFDVRAASDERLDAACREHGIADRQGRGRMLDKLFGVLVQPSLIQPTFVLDHPVELSPLAKPHRTEPGLTERFELFVAGEEFANAFSELNDPAEQRERFEAQVRMREAGDDEAQALDEDYIRALEYGMPPTGGVGVGVDRLVMLLTDRSSIRDVILFPTLRPEEGEETRSDGADDPAASDTAASLP